MLKATLVENIRETDLGKKRAALCAREYANGIVPGACLALCNVMI